MLLKWPEFKGSSKNIHRVQYNRQMLLTIPSAAVIWLWLAAVS